jgi:hypothetical protein
VAQEVPSGEFCGEVIPPDPALLTGEHQLSGEPIEAGASLLNTRGSFSVAAWVKLDATDAPMAIISQEGGVSSNFVLGVTDGKFAFTTYGGFGENPVSAAATEPIEAGKWYHVVGVLDVGDGEMRLYVDGELQASIASVHDWNAQGSTVIGAAKQRGQRIDPFTGAVRGIHLYAGALDADEIAALAAE